MGFKIPQLKLPGFNKKKEVTDSSTTFEEKNVVLQEKMNRIYKFGGIAGMAVGVLSLLALNGALPLKSTVVEAYLINGVTGVAERLTSVKKKISLKMKRWQNTLSLSTLNVAKVITILVFSMTMIMYCSIALKMWQLNIML